MIALIVLYVSFPMETQNAAGCSAIQCRERRGICSFVRCRPPLRTIGKCTALAVCCRR
uniref:Beta-defensin-like domain-containing protein n=1 Tax=Cyanistes caeruleus TaxID=156563 RepID=A0A8C0VLM4_CYACU